MSFTVAKKFNAVSDTGLGVAKNGKLQFPFKFQAEKIQSGQMPSGFNAFGQAYPQIGDFCACALPSGILSAGTVGRIIAEGDSEFHKGGSFKVALLDGTTLEMHKYGIGVLTEAQAKEVRDYYVKKEKRPERVKRDFWAS